MRPVLNKITDFIGNTPLIELSNTWKGNGRLLAKMEFIQPGGSVKDRVALQIIKDAYQNKKLEKGRPVVEMTSGNMGAGLAVVCAAVGNPFIAVMSMGNSPERLKILKALGAEVIRVPQVDGLPGKVTGNDIAAATEKAIGIAKEKNAFYVDQFNNPSCVTAHYATTGPEIWNALQGKVDAFAANLGTGATFIGTARFLEEQKKDIYCAAVEPENAAILKKGYIENPKHIIQGTGYGVVMPFWDAAAADDILTVTDEEVENQTRLLARDEGLYVGYSSGANVRAAVKLMESGILKENPVVVTILCDTAYKYSLL
ncbi:MAG: cysteine synthase family protein [bacterium]|nr:cysteine synthase family protein [bacterium]